MLTRAWRKRGVLAAALLPIGWLFFLVVALRRGLYRAGLLRSERLPVPVVVVGNITVGGAGKTPLVIWLANELRQRGRQPGIVSRGYGRTRDGQQKVGAGDTPQSKSPGGTPQSKSPGGTPQSKSPGGTPQSKSPGGTPKEVLLGDTPNEVGDEPLLLARRTACPVFVGRDRVAAARALLAAHPECDLILCDDGLQHYRLARDVEIAVLDGRGIMNGWPLPSGPLREPVSRLRSVDALVLNGGGVAPLAGIPVFDMQLVGERFERLGDPAQTCTASELSGRHLHALAGIGDPARFFAHLAALGLACETHAFPDHHRYVADDLPRAGDAIVTTEKDAVKLPVASPLTAHLPIWVLPVDARIAPDLARFVVERIDGRPPA